MRGGNPGNKGGGRKKKEFYDWVEGLVNSTKVRKRVRRMLTKAAEDGDFNALFKFLVEQKYGKAKQPVDAKLGLTIEDLTGKPEDDDA